MNVFCGIFLFFGVVDVMMVVFVVIAVIVVGSYPPRAARRGKKLQVAFLFSAGGRFARRERFCFIKSVPTAKSIGARKMYTKDGLGVT